MPNCKSEVTKSAEYRAYTDAKSRCTNPNHPAFSDYGGRGIEFRFPTFTHFIRAVGMRPSSKFCLDRIDNGAHYEWGNVRWATRGVSTLNRRQYKNGKSGFRGVSIATGYKDTRWRAFIRHEGRRIALGTFDSAFEAARAYDAAAKELHGLYALLNFPEES